jgi:hypothetical protein
MLSTAIQMPGEFLTFGEQPDGKIQAVVDLSGVYFDDKGVVKTSFLERIVTTAPNLEARRTIATTSRSLIRRSCRRDFIRCESRRVTTRAERSEARTRGSRYPTWRRKKLTMSSLLLGERTQAMMTNVSNPGGVESGCAQRQPSLPSANRRCAF